MIESTKKAKNIQKKIVQKAKKNILTNAKKHGKIIITETNKIFYKRTIKGGKHSANEKTSKVK